MESRLGLGGLGAGLMDRGLSRVAIVRREVEGRYIVTEAEREVADLLPIEVDPAVARATVKEVPFWFHTFALNRAAGIYTPGVARDHRYRVSTLPSDFGGMSVLDVATFDGFYAFLAEDRGADRVVAIDNEQYRLWVASRWGVELAGGEGFRTIHRLLDSGVEYRRMDAFELDRSDERFESSTASASSTESRTRSGCCACCGGGRPAAASCWSRPTASARQIETKARSASRRPVRSTRATNSSTGGLEPSASSGLPGSQASRAPIRSSTWRSTITRASWAG
jgi:hypothetical protein